MDCCGRGCALIEITCTITLVLFKPGREDQATISCLPKIHWSLLHIKLSKKGLIARKQNLMWQRNPLLLPLKNKIDTVNKTEKSQAYKRKR